MSEHGAVKTVVEYKPTQGEIKTSIKLTQFDDRPGQQHRTYTARTATVDAKPDHFSTIASDQGDTDSLRVRVQTGDLRRVAQTLLAHADATLGLQEAAALDQSQFDDLVSLIDVAMTGSWEPAREYSDAPGEIAHALREAGFGLTLPLHNEIARLRMALTEAQAR